MLPSSDSYDIVIVGGGFFGTYLALQLQRQNIFDSKDSKSASSANKKILILEREKEILTRASLINQARVHGGYHYPRSLVTGLRSQENYRRFTEEFSDCINKSFKKYYAISRNSSAVTAQQFRFFCERIGAPLKNAPVYIAKEFDTALIEEVFEVDECAFDATKLRKRMLAQLKENSVEICTSAEALQITKTDSSTGLTVKLRDGNNPDADVSINSSKIFLCTYSFINEVLSNSKLPQIPVRNEFTEMCLVKPCGFLENAGVTVMCGPFFSIMPYPPHGLHTFSHVRYTPHFSWQENDTLGPPQNAGTLPKNVKSHFLHMLKDSQRYLPVLKDIKYVDSLWERKTLLPRNEMDDARPILLKQNHGLSNLTCIVGAKIDNVFDVCSALGLQS